MLGSIDLMHNGVMPPFAGLESERGALTAFLAGMRVEAAGKGAVSVKPVFERYCAPCHQLKKQDALFTRLENMDPSAADEALKDLPAIFIRMPNLHLNQQERESLIQWVRQRSSAGI